MKIIITGGAGFIGSHLAEFLVKKGHKIVIIDNLSTGRLSNIKTFKNSIKFVKADISKIGKWIENFENTQVVYHLAALADIVPSIQNPKKYFESNVVGTENIASASIKYKVKKVIYSASSSCYGIPKNYPTLETASIEPQYPYALTKNLGEQILIHYAKIYGVNVTSLRLFNVYGTRSRTSGTYGAMFGVFLAQKLKNKPLTVVGDGKQKRDFTYISDVIQAFYKAIKIKKNFQTFNLGTGKPVAVNEIVKLLGCKSINIPKRPGEPDLTSANITKIKKELNWKPKISIKQGIKNLLNEINYWNSAPVWTPKKIKVATKDWFKYLGNN
ncbi:UDP-glucose 4-epimerase [Candidatus Pelagibacter sp. HTCC7211]|uniref:GDP-mannose 4,6-dehydratase n=1 Tax=Pelagibacter sp. (strain HTCC7211) TaxID=439493 RepID=UPI000183AC89|nr:GDP-mannose 4,6-dehydratase [Candidatus Pelagibacter sp. HTCC7211]EDZ59849.1 UDP-glucose 4-epimerase [Candidatus Pelagibacter sp. HTCC7211]